MYNIWKKLKEFRKTKHKHFLFVNWDEYKKYGLLIRIAIRLNPNYLSCKIYRKQYKNYENIVVVGLKWYGKNVKRRTNGYAKEQLESVDTCLFCHSKLNEVNVTADHIIPISQGGSNSKVNLVACCDNCNGERGDSDFYEYFFFKRKDLSHKDKNNYFI